MPVPPEQHAAMSSNQNPYAADFDRPADPLHVREAATQPIVAKLVYTSYHQRIIALRGELNAVIEWNATGLREFAAVDGERVINAFSWGIRRLFEFEIVDNGRRFQIRLEVRSFFNLAVTGLRLFVDGTLVFTEGKWPAE